MGRWIVPSRADMQDFKQECIALRKQGKSLIDIMKITGRSKTSVYFHIKDMPLSKKRWVEIKERQGKYIREFALARKGKSKKPFTAFPEWNERMVLLVAHLVFDGEIVRGRCVYSNRNSVLIERVINLMEDIYAFPPSTYMNSQTRVVKAMYHNVALAQFLHDKAVFMVRNIFQFPKGQQRKFLVAFFDDEGCMDMRIGSNKRRVRGYQKNVAILHLVKNLLGEFGITASIVKPNEVVITGKENLKRFQKEINFSEGVMLHGDRKNSVHKKPIQKRDLLQQAIDSFVL